MPVVTKLMDALVKRYGPDEGKRVYYAMEAEGKGPFSENGKYRNLHVEFARKHNVTPISSRAKKKARPKKGRASPDRRRRA